MELSAFAKINLTLDITDRKTNGYHNLDSVMQSISLCDTVKVEMSKKTKVLCDNDKLSGEKNIAYKAARAFFDYTSISGGAEIFIQKNIPVLSGMGGGSADAAAVIVALDKIYKTGLKDDELINIAKKVGSDVPFCIFGSTARVEGIGEKITPISAIPDCAFLILKQGEKQSTEDMYKRLDDLKCSRVKATAHMITALESGDIRAVADFVSNDFKYVTDITPQIKLLSSQNPLCVNLTGSGPTVYAVFADENSAISAQERLMQNGVETMLAHPVDCGIKKKH